MLSLRAWFGSREIFVTPLPRFIASKRQENTMPQSTHDRAAELHNLAAHAHNAAADAHGKGDHLTAHELSVEAHELSRNAHQHSAQLKDEMEKAAKA